MSIIPTMLIGKGYFLTGQSEKGYQIINFKMSNKRFRISFAVLCSSIGTRLTSKRPPWRNDQGQKRPGLITTSWVSQDLFSLNPCCKSYMIPCASRCLTMFDPRMCSNTLQRMQVRRTCTEYYKEENLH